MDHHHGITVTQLLVCHARLRAGPATITIEVFLAGVNSPVASLVHHVTTGPFPNVVPHQQAARERALASLADVEPVNRNVRILLAGELWCSGRSRRVCSAT